MVIAEVVVALDERLDHFVKYVSRRDLYHVHQLLAIPAQAHRLPG
jgi:hypothetical protein